MESMIVGYAQNGHDKDAIALFENMLQQKFKSDNVTHIGVYLLVSILMGLSKDGYFKQSTWTDIYFGSLCMYDQSLRTFGLHQ